ncbi:CaiB/BaiF CoA transferase family protein [Cupriavidus alkaliphilus]|uniref:CaiB/BaiF CoA transferase family protein n=1 Tax=Cupriavidus alkaliphilus TaxID=942866 RepID=UPI00160AD837|nr:CaiB/BaiF CoA-transferase family protein [Cupriavidus alkaliphilus]MBB2919995.1 crotonobetainyl-CoA:carnitine CoA-transferase CaiB-like acyl-CoA transferase [Cupriavidus alkaliphilus]
MTGSTVPRRKQGPLAGVKIVELAGIGPGPMAAMLLADMGADVLRIERETPVDLGVPKPLRYNLTLRNRRVIALDLKQPQAVQRVLRLVAEADGLIEGFRPGVTERLGLGPDQCLARNSRLVYGRITGWGQHGPLAHVAGHDINYIALTGALDAIGRNGEPPAVPLALLGDMSGGALYLAMGMLAALLEARTSGQGQVVDAAIVDGTASMAMTFFGLAAAGKWRAQRGSNILDSGAPFYDVYQCADGKWISIGPIEARFHAELLQRMGLRAEAIGGQMDEASWPRARAVLAAAFRTRSRADWCALLEGTDVCFAPVLSFAEAPEHPHLKARGTFVEVDGVVQPAPAPRFSRTPAAEPTPPQAPGDLGEALAGWLAPDEIAAWQQG